MQFEFNGERFSFRFGYPKPVENVREIEAREIYLPAKRADGHGSILGGGPGEGILVTVTTVHRPVRCLLFKWDESAAKRGGELIAVRESWASPKDVFSRKIGREIALARYAHDNPFVQYERVPDTNAQSGYRWVWRWGDVQKGAEFYQAMKTAWERRKEKRGAGEGAKGRAGEARGSGE